MDGGWKMPMRPRRIPQQGDRSSRAERRGSAVPRVWPVPGPNCRLMKRIAEAGCRRSGENTLGRKSVEGLLAGGDGEVILPHLVSHPLPRRANLGAEPEPVASGAPNSPGSYPGRTRVQVPRREAALSKGSSGWPLRASSRPGPHSTMLLPTRVGRQASASSSASAASRSCGTAVWPPTVAGTAAFPPFFWYT